MAEKQRMFAKQEERRAKAFPMPMKHQANFAKALLAKLDGIGGSTGPAQISMSTPPPLADDHVPQSEDPEPIGGCFSDIMDEDDSYPPVKKEENDDNDDDASR